MRLSQSAENCHQLAASVGVNDGPHPGGHRRLRVVAAGAAPVERSESVSGGVHEEQIGHLCQEWCVVVHIPVGEFDAAVPVGQEQQRLPEINGEERHSLSPKRAEDTSVTPRVMSTSSN